MVNLLQMPVRWLTSAKQKYVFYSIILIRPFCTVRNLAKVITNRFCRLLTIYDFILIIYPTLFANGLTLVKNNYFSSLCTNYVSRDNTNDKYSILYIDKTYCTVHNTVYYSVQYMTLIIHEQKKPSRFKAKWFGAVFRMLLELDFWRSRVVLQALCKLSIMFYQFTF